MEIENIRALNERLNAFRREELRRRREKELERERYLEKSVAEKSRAERVMLSHCVPATINDYKEWLKGYLSAGNIPTHFYDYPFERVAEDFFLGMEDFEVVPLYGANGVSIIVPSGTNVLGNDTGHNRLYFEEGYKTLGSHGSSAYVPIYSDIAF